MALFKVSSLDPMSGLLALQRELDRVFENPTGFDLGVSGRGVFPAANMFQDEAGYAVRVEVPGVAPDQVHVETQGRTLTISGKREVPAPDGGAFHRRERSSGEFSRSLQLPDDVDFSRAEATCKHGVLTVRLPKKQESLPRQISVQAA
jgi:HSP20 family protein